MVSLPTGSKPYGLFVDDMNIYWTNFGTGEVMQAKLDGSSQVTLTTKEKSPVAVAAQGGLVYWVSYSEFGILRSAPVGGGAVVDLSLAVAAREMVVGTDYIWWTGEPDDIMRAPRLGLPDGGVADLLTLNPLSNGLAADASYLYWTNRFDGFVKKANYDLTGETPLASGDVPWDVVVDATSIYWTEQGLIKGTGKVMKAKKTDGSGPTMIAADGQGPQGIAIDATHVYWANKDDGTIKRAPLAGGKAVTLAPGQSGPANVVVDATHVYWTNFTGDAIVKVSK